MARKFDLSLILGAKDNATSTLDKISNKVGLTKTQLLALGAAAATATAAFVAFSVKAIQKASDLEETQSKFNVVFRNNLALAEEWTETLQDSFAMSEIAAKKNLSAIQDLLVPMGLARDEAAQLSFQVVKLSADLGSFNNLPTEDVMRDIQSALVGNFETMKKYGVVLNATLVQQEAMNLGFADSVKELTQADKAQAAYNLIIKGSTDAMGDMERTSASFANQMKFLHAAIEDITTEMGKALLPIATQFVNILNTKLVPLVKLASVEVGKWNDEILATAKFVLKLTGNMIKLIDAISGFKFARDVLVAIKESTDEWDISIGKVSEDMKLLKDDTVAANEEMLASTQLRHEETLAGELSLFDARKNMLMNFMAIQKTEQEKEKANWITKLGVMLQEQTKWYAKNSKLRNGFISATSAGFDTMIKGIGTGWDVLGKGMTQIMSGLKNTIIKAIADIAAEWVVKTVLMKGASLAFGAAVWLVNQAIIAAKVIAGWATIPFVGVALGIAAAAAAISQMAQFKGFANGVRGFSGGMAMVGERGPELVNLPGGSDVLNNAETKNMLAQGSSSGGRVINVFNDFSESTFLGTKDEFAEEISVVMMDNLRLQGSVS